MTDLQIKTLLEQAPRGTTIVLAFLRLPDGPVGDADSASESKISSPADGNAGKTTLKLKHAAKLYPGIPAAELKRAVDGGFIAHTLKKTGRDAGAELVERSDVDAYIERRAAIRRREEERPDDWPDAGGVR